MARGGPVPRPRHVPQRTCVACRQGQAKRELVRIVRLASGAVRVDPTGKLSGRGAYLHRDADCWAIALKRGLLPRALRMAAIPAADLAAISGQWSAASGQPTAADTGAKEGLTPAGPTDH